MATVMSLGKKMGKAAVVSLNAPGFIGNRMLWIYIPGKYALLEGAPKSVDSALESFGMSMGPFRMDLVGLDLGWKLVN